MPVSRILFVAISVALLLLGCKTDPSKVDKKSQEPTPSPPRESIEAEGQRDVHPQRGIPNFSGKEAFSYLTAQTDFGPRNPGSPGHAQCLNYLLSELQRSAEKVTRQEFYHTGYRGERLRMTNIIASFNIATRDRILLAAHWDTRPYADQETDPAKRDQPILGANDGASGVAVLLQIAKIMRQNPPPIGVDIVLFDGEDFGRSGDLENFLLGSKHFSRHKGPSFNPRYGVVVDMIGDAQLEISKEQSSVRYAPDVVDYVWAIAERLGLKEFVPFTGPDVYDDHVPLNEVGIKTINIIDFNYPDRSHRYWHTIEDTPDKCSPSSLEKVGTLLTHLIYSKPI